MQSLGLVPDPDVGEPPVPVERGEEDGGSGGGHGQPEPFLGAGQEKVVEGHEAEEEHADSEGAADAERYAAGGSPRHGESERPRHEGECAGEDRDRIAVIAEPEVGETHNPPPGSDGVKSDSGAGQLRGWIHGRRRVREVQARIVITVITVEARKTIM